MRPARLLLSLTTAALPVGSAIAADGCAVGPRALGMGGTGVASTRDTSAQFYNPAVDNPPPPFDEPRPELDYRFYALQFREDVDQ